MLDIGTEVVRACIGIGRGNVQVERPSRRVVCEVRVHGGDFTSVCLHAPSGLTGLDVAPDHRRHIAWVVHETSIEVGSLIWIRRGDMDPTAREWVFLLFHHQPQEHMKWKTVEKLTKKWNMVKNLPGGMSMWSPNQPEMTE